METERKFLIKEFPQLPLLYDAVQYQGYISTNPVVRIRCEISKQKEEYKLCFKGKGTIQREEVEIDIDKSTFNKLKKLLDKQLIEKIYKKYKLGEHTLECSLVDKGTETQFMYAEIEFKNLQSALDYIPPSFLKDEVTYVKGMSMADYWKSKK